MNWKREDRGFGKGNAFDRCQEKHRKNFRINGLDTKGTQKVTLTYL